jgi:hypothetical protein
VYVDSPRWSSHKSSSNGLPQIYISIMLLTRSIQHQQKQQNQLISHQLLRRTSSKINMKNAADAGRPVASPRCPRWKFWWSISDGAASVPRQHRRWQHCWAKCRRRHRGRALNEWENREKYQMNGGRYIF